MYNCFRQYYFKISIKRKELASILLKRKYPLQVIKTGFIIGFIKALQIPRSSLLNVHDKINKNIIPYISTHNPKNREVFEFRHY